MLQKDDLEKWNGVVICFNNGFKIKGVMKALRQDDDSVSYQRTTGDIVDVNLHEMSAIITTPLFNTSYKEEGREVFSHEVVKRWIQDHSFKDDV